MYTDAGWEPKLQATQIQRLFEDSAGNVIYCKRDDLYPLSFGGNKARKARGFFREIDKGNYDCVVTYGSSSSNHCRVVANMAAARALPCYIISPAEASEPTYNSMMTGVFGAETTVVPVEAVHDTIEAKLAALKAQGKQPYFIAGGGHGNLGTQAYVDCYEEMLAQETELDICFDYVFFASGTGTTHAGLVCGQLIHGDKKHIVGISIARKNPRGRKVVMDSIWDYLSEKELFIPESEVEAATVFIDDYTGEGYGKDSEEVKACVRALLVTQGIPTDTTYTAKAFCGMTKYLQKNEVAGSNILFIHTGGTPLFFDTLKQL